jgi:NAD(P)-dependent dehydrogenase (short-subunit alcohol dehydrogenase family)/acyl carrier protein
MGILNHSLYKNNRDGIILITGGSGYLASELIKVLNPLNKRLILVAHSQSEALQKKSKQSTEVISYDLASNSLEGLFSKIKNPEKIETVYHLACPNPAKSSYENLWKVNVEVLHEIAGRVLPIFNRRGWGDLIVMGSRYAFYPPMESELLNYSMVKAAQLTATRHWALRSRSPLIRFIYLAPTHFFSPLNRTRKISNLLSASVFANHLVKRLPQFSNGDAIFFDTINDEILESVIGKSQVTHAPSDTPALADSKQSSATTAPNASMARDFVQKFQELFPSALRLPEKEIIDLKMGDIPEWDSLGHLRLVVEMEGLFKKNIPSQTLGSIVTVRGLMKEFNVSAER